ncbi:Crp/Fnr family transcriptional regulator [Sphingobacterium sp. SGR-19]|uniref:Crp/Fnr family transcriptional regulator n=1 Tax=Sphingobacterium sp. SGR-19 TaxID=2710886 RepID=UPI0013EC0375|nr:Crp/Fnr family transcriptional regulator [Sphingobacterium sp. SGR-19]NGM66870.1 Crp/Fnr family transcriptional regulator [Sphingobacterium sp. SGR-19]
MEKIRQFFGEFVTIDDLDWEIFSSKLERAAFPKKSVILEQGKKERFLSFLEKGIIRFNIPKVDYDFTFAFAFENTFFSAYDSFLTQTGSHYNIECITDCVLHRISYKDLEFVYANTSIGDRIGRKVAEDLYVKKMKRERSLLEDTAKKRYMDLLSEQPHLLKYIPQKYLASYIGIRPQSLSRIRKTI